MDSNHRPLPRQSTTEAKENDLDRIEHTLDTSRARITGRDHRYEIQVVTRVAAALFGAAGQQYFSILTFIQKSSPVGIRHGLRSNNAFPLSKSVGTDT